MTPKPLKKIKCNGNPCEDCRQPYEACGCKCHQTSGTETNVKNMEIEEKENWEIEFDKLVNDALKDHPLRLLTEWHEICKRFIRQTLTSDRLSLVEVLEGMRKDYGCQHDQDGACYAGKYENQICSASYNLCITEIISRLKK